ncbi:hypothetical protein AMAG_08124 [Allomyces macrogynus ATCC 38327]|uniref:Retinol dehydrogenase 12 n=1 Tax=Allomyces macrogynus (strain ATCC 38327) TaxID=578462 RepID=A0A0L0SKL3_ALLM3|nr:hypothetical protein AMAG_08124 [Allomyces macrogynus ATCC 38327]|eukprot:KNE62949.1 hypothetical protein AMAG_08124 [Allomyces macrogynus ATCC 38327]
MGNGFSTNDIPNLEGKTYLVTGANTGIGYQTALYLAKNKGKVILACRSADKAHAAMDAIRAKLKADGTTHDPQLDFLELDLGSLKQVATAARSVVAKGEKIDALINNAGIMAVPYRLTQDGLESQFGTNHMGHFVFTMLVLPVVPKNTGRIVNLTSLLHYYSYSFGLGTLEQVFVDPAAPKPADGEKHPSEAVYSPSLAYGQSKLCNMLFTKYLASKQPHLRVFAVHPGVVDTNLHHHVQESYSGVVGKAYTALAKVVGKKPVNGARTSLAAATSPQLDQDPPKVPSGSYFEPYGEVAEPSAFAKDPALQQRLWEMSIELVRRTLGEETVKEIERNIAQTESAHW